MEKSNPGSRKKDLRSTLEPKSKQLEDVGVSKPQAHRLEQMAAVPAEKFEECVVSTG